VCLKVSCVCIACCNGILRCMRWSHGAFSVSECVLRCLQCVRVSFKVSQVCLKVITGVLRCLSVSVCLGVF